MMSPPPDGISANALDMQKGYANPLPLVLLTLLLIAGLIGLMGGNPSPKQGVENQNLKFSIHSPTIVRSGMTFETQFTVRAKRPIHQLSLSVSDGLWRDMTINTMIPSATEEAYRDGAHHFTFSDLPSGGQFQFKVDGQVNPPLIGKVRGPIIVWDGPTKLAEIDFQTMVLP